MIIIHARRREHARARPDSSEKFFATSPTRARARRIFSQRSSFSLVRNFSRRCSTREWKNARAENLFTRSSQAANHSRRVMIVASIGHTPISRDIAITASVATQHHTMSEAMDVETTTPSSRSCDDDYARLRLTDVIPCNLRDESKFLASVIEADISRCSLRRFLRCYGFLMYDKEDKLRALRSTGNQAVCEIADVLSECRSLAEFKLCVEEHLEYIRAILADPQTVDMFLAEENHGGGGASEQRDQIGSGVRMLHMARRALEFVFDFIRKSDLMRRQLNANEYCRRNLLRHTETAKRALTAVYDAWHDSARGDCDADRCVSIVFRDIIVTTGLQTHSAILFVVRSALLLTYLITTFMYHRRNDGAARPASVNLTLPPKGSLDENDETIRDYWTSFEEMTVEKFISTTMISVTRMYLNQCVRWPQTIREMADGSTVPLDRVQTVLTAKLAQSAEQRRGSQRLSWLRVMRAGHRTPSNANPLYGTNARRLYVNVNSLLKLFEDLSIGMKTPATISDDAKTMADDVAPQYCGGGGGFVSSANMRPDANSQLPNLYNQYCLDEDLCLTTLIECLNESAKSLSHLNSFDEFVATRNSGYRGPENDAAAAAALSSSSDVDDLGTDVSRSLLFAVLSLVRYDIEPKVYGSLSDEHAAKQLDCEKYESHRVLLLHAMSHVFRMKMTLAQLTELLGFLVRIWHTHVGVIGIEQFSEILLALFRLFPVADCLNDSNSGCGDNDSWSV